MPWWMIILLLFYGAACLFLIFVILIQSGKEGGLSSLGSASQGISDAFGATGAERTLNKLTTWSAVGFMVLAIVISLLGANLARRQGGGLIREEPAAEAPAMDGESGFIMPEPGTEPESAGE